MLVTDSRLWTEEQLGLLDGSTQLELVEALSAHNKET
jgi:hypothetical protein